MSDRITVIYRRVGEEPLAIEIDHTLERMQELVGGDIERVSLGHGLNLICNEEGLIYELPLNANIQGHDIHGDFFLCRNGEEGEFASANPADMDILRGLLADVKGWKLLNGCHRGTMMSRDSGVFTHTREGDRKLASLEDCTVRARQLRDSYESMGYYSWYATAVDPEGKEYPIRERGMHTDYANY